MIFHPMIVCVALHETEIHLFNDLQIYLFFFRYFFHFYRSLYCTACLFYMLRFAPFLSFTVKTGVIFTMIFFIIDLYLQLQRMVCSPSAFFYLLIYFFVVFFSIAVFTGNERGNKAQGNNGGRGEGVGGGGAFKSETRE